MNIFQIATCKGRPSASILVPLTQGKVTLISTADVDLVSVYRWTAVKSQNTWYAKAHVGSKTLYMHRQILLGENADCIPCKVDHVNGDGLDNRRENLRTATHGENMMNSVGRPASRRSRFKGVSVRKHRFKPFRACIEVDGKQKHLGYFVSEEDAARAYDSAAVAYFGSHSRLNFRVDLSHERSAA